MSKTIDPTSDELRSATEPEKSPGEKAEDQFMFTIKGEIKDDPAIEWSEDRSQFTWTFEMDELDVNVRSDPGKPAKVIIKGSRRRAYFMWGNIDGDLVADLQRYERTGQSSSRLDEVKRALGVEDDDSNS